MRLTLERELDKDLRLLRLLEDLPERRLDLLLEDLLELLLEDLLETRLDLLLEDFLEAFLVLVIGSRMSATLRVLREELEELLDEVDWLERELLELELLELEEVRFFIPGARIFFSFIRTFLSSRMPSF